MMINLILTLYHLIHLQQRIVTMSTSNSGTPTWVWLVGIIVGILVICGLAVCGLVVFVGDSVQPLLDDFTSTIEAEGGAGTGEPSVVEVDIPTLDAGEVPTLALPTLEPLDGETVIELPTLAPTEVVETTVDKAVPTAEGADEQISAAPVSINQASVIDTFDSEDDWGIGKLATDDVVEVAATVENGVLRFESFKDGFYWTTSSEDLADGTYEIEATAVDGSLNNGMGLLFFGNDDTDDFYLFEVSSDGYVWIGLCDNGCEELTMLVDDGWFESDAVKQGLGETNRLRVEASGGSMSFYVNDIWVGDSSNTTLSHGTIGVVVESFEDGPNVAIEYDNFTFTPAP